MSTTAMNHLFSTAPELAPEFFEVPQANEMEPTLQLTIYQPKLVKGNYTERREQIYVEACHVRREGKEYVCDTPRPLQRRELGEVGNALIQYHLIAPPYFGYGSLLLYMPHASGPRIVWWVEQRLQFVRFGGEMRSLGAGSVVLPRTLFVINKNKLHVFCLPLGAVNEKTPLLVNPYPNCYNDGSVCMGTASAPDLAKCPSVDEYMRQWEQLFWYSEFSHTNTRSQSPLKKGYNQAQIWHDMMVEKSAFPIDALMPEPQGRTIEHLLVALNK